jgi:hypothetical protein
VPKKIWRKKTIYEKVNARGLTAIELAELEKITKIKRGKARATTPRDFEDKDKEGFLVPDSPLFTRTDES